MYPVSAVDSVIPAVQRTRIFLFQPFRLGTYLKLCLVALITEGFGSSFQFPGPSRHSSTPTMVHPTAFPSPFHATPGILAAIAFLALLAFLLALLISYLITRLRFAYFHCLIHNTKEIGPGWRLYRFQALRFFWMTLVVGICFLLAVIAVAFPFVSRLWKLIHNLPPGGRPDLGALLALILPLIPVVLLIIVAAVAIDLVLRDLLLPHYALENATAGQAWSAAWSRISMEMGAFFVYGLLRVLLPIAAMIGLAIAMIIPGLLFVAVIAIVEVGLHSAFAGAAGAGAMAGIFFQALVGVLAVCIALVVILSVGGPLSTATREYALVFYGGRYQLLGDILYPPPAARSPGIV